MKIALLITALLLGLCAYIGLKEIDAPMGGGIYKESPNKQYILNRSSLTNANPLPGNDEVYAEITIHRGSIANKEIKRIIVTPINAKSEMSYRSLDDPIEWKEDSSEATVTTPDFTITININPNQAQVSTP